MSKFSDFMKQSDDVQVSLDVPKKVQKVFIGVNTLANIDQWVYSNHMPFFFDCGRLREQTRIKFILFAPPRMSIDRMRNEAARIALEQECTHLMFIDDDVCLPEDSLRKLLKANKDIVAGVTYVRSYPFNPMIFDFSRKENDFFMTDFKERIHNGLVKCDAVGFSCVLISMELLKKTPPPYFVTGVNYTEDVYFCKKVTEYFPETSIFVDPTIVTSHKLGTEFIDDSNMDFWKDYYKEVQKPKEDSYDRGDEYLKENALIET